MQLFKYVWAGGLALLAAGLNPGPASANLDLDEMAAALALPLITGHPVLRKNDWFRGHPLTQAESVITITNGSSSDITLHINVISGDFKDEWRSDSFDCPLTARETVIFFVEPFDNYTSVLEYECDTVNNTPADESSKKRFLLARTGILFAAIESPVGHTLGQNYIFGDATVIDEAGGTAYSVEAIAFQGKDANNDRNRKYRFDGQEYDPFPRALATNFLAPGGNFVAPRKALSIPDESDDVVDAELILFTLDGTLGLDPTPKAKVDVVAYNDDEEYFDIQFSFDCFVIVRLLDISLNFLASNPGHPGLGSPGGHLQLTPRPVGTDTHDAHDAAYGDNDSVRNRPIHGWIVQTFLVDSNPEHTEHGGWTLAAGGRPLAQSRLNHTPEPTDPYSVLDAETNNSRQERGPRAPGVSRRGGEDRLPPASLATMLLLNLIRNRRMPPWNTDLR